MTALPILRSTSLLCSVNTSGIDGMWDSQIVIFAMPLLTKGTRWREFPWLSSKARRLYRARDIAWFR